MTCPDCKGYGRVSNGRDPMDPAYDDFPCPNPDCEDGAFERGDVPSQLHPVFAQILRAVQP
jgi:hypothetical protein